MFYCKCLKTINLGNKLLKPFNSTFKKGKRCGKLSAKNQFASYVILFFYLIFCCSSLKTTHAEITHGQLSSKNYTEPKGFFRIMPPANWRVHRTASRQ